MPTDGCSSKSQAYHGKWIYEPISFWKALEAPGVEPVFPQKDQAIDYAQSRACFRSGEIRIFDSTGNVERIMPFDDTTRKL